MTKHQPRSLRDIALTAKEKHGGGGRKLSRIATENKHKITQTTLDSLIAGTYVSRPTKATLEALAFLAEEPIVEVYKVAGIPYGETKLADQLPSGVDELGKDERETLIAVARTLLRQSRETHQLRLELDAITKQEEKTLTTNNDTDINSRVADVLASLARLAGTEVSTSRDETIDRLPDNMRGPARTLVAEMLTSADQETDDWGTGGATVHHIHPERGGEPLAADDRHGLSEGQHRQAQMDVAGEHSQDPGGDHE